MAISTDTGARTGLTTGIVLDMGMKLGKTWAGKVYGGEAGNKQGLGINIRAGWARD